MRRRALLAALLAGAALPWSGRAATLPAAQRATLTAAARALFPHAAVPDATYAAIVAAAVAGATPAQAAALAAAAKALGPPAKALPQRVAANLALPGVQALRIATLLGLYGNLAVVRQFGYPGPSLEDGGWLDRGFDDLAWLPAPGPAFLP